MKPVNLMLADSLHRHVVLLIADSPPPRRAGRRGQTRAIEYYAVHCVGGVAQADIARLMGVSRVSVHRAVTRVENERDANRRLDQWLDALEDRLAKAAGGAA
jgi:thiamine monophosphate synthase